MTILFAGGGTGGHLFPAVAIAEALQEIEPQTEAVFVGTKEKIEARIIPGLGHRFHAIWIRGLRRRLSPGNLLFPVRIIVAMMQTYSILRRERPAAVIGTGGYVSGPVVLVARLSGFPTVVQEQNSYPGFTTRLLARLADEVHVSFPETIPFLPAAKSIRISGNPIRMRPGRVRPAEARRHFGLDAERLTLLVFGGSLGASAINRATSAMIRSVRALDAQVLWQTGDADYSSTRSAVEGMPGVVVRPFIGEMDLAYAAADLLVCRSGATTVAEITALGKAAVLVPYPHAAADHQLRNAQTLADAEAAILLPEEKIAELGTIVCALLPDAVARRRLAERAAALGRPDAAGEIARSILQLVARRSGSGREKTP